MGVAYAEMKLCLRNGISFMQLRQGCPCAAAANAVATQANVKANLPVIVCKANMTRFTCYMAPVLIGA